MAAIESFEDLRVYNAAFRAAMRIYELSKSWPTEERYSLADQIRWSSRSVCGQVAEAWRKRRYPNAFVSKLQDALGEVAETENWLNFSKECRYIPESDYCQLRIEYNQVSGGLVEMVAHPDKWCGAMYVRELPDTELSETIVVHDFPAPQSTTS